MRIGNANLTINWPVASAAAWRGGIFLIAAFVVVFLTTHWNRWEGRSGWQVTDDAYLQADVTPVAAKVGGYIRNISVEDYQRVKAGDLLVEINDDDYRATVAQAKASVASAKAQAATLSAQTALQGATVGAANAVVSATQASWEQNTRDVARQAVLLRTGSSSTEATEKLDTTRAQLTAQLQQTKSQAAAAARQLNVLAAQQDQAQAVIAAQQASLELAAINLNYTRILAPQDGVLGQRLVKPGQFVGTGTQIASLSPIPHVWAIANYKETQLTHMTVGDQVEIEVDTFPGHVLRGHLLAFSPASGAQFALLPPDNATGNFTKVVQRVAVKIVIDDADGLAARLLPGMSIVTRVHAVDGG